MKRIEKVKLHFLRVVTEYRMMDHKHDEPIGTKLEAIDIDTLKVMAKPFGKNSYKRNSKATLSI
jgi:hypothetical protein